MSRWGDRSPGRAARAVALAGVSLWLAAAADAARAATDPGFACRLTQLSAASKLYTARHACWAKAYASLHDPTSCLVKAEQRFAGVYQAAAAKAAKSGGHCGLRLDVGSLLSISASDVDPLVGAIAGNVDFESARDLKFRAKLMLATGALAARAFAAEIDFARRGDDTRRTQLLGTAVDRFDLSFTGVEKSANVKGILYQGPTSDGVSAAVEGWAALWERITRSDLGAYSLSGTIYAAESTFVDSDVNDTNVTPVDNGSLIEDAQPLAVPSTVGGYVNTPQAGAPGNSFDFGDSMDRYFASLRAGQVVLLSIGDPAGDQPGQADLDLCLWGPKPPSGNMPDPLCSEGIGAYELTVAPSDGEYFIEVFPKDFCACGSNYTLSVGQTVPAAAMRTERTDVEFVPGELVVKLRATPAAAGARAQALALPADVGLSRVAGETTREMLVQLPASATARTAAFKALGAAAEHAQLSAKGLSAADLSRQETLLALRSLRQRPEFESVSLNYVMHPALVPNDPLYTLQWHYPLIHLPQAWDLTTGDPSVIVAVVDTGVRLDHPDLAGQLVPGYDFIRDASRARDGDGIDPDPNDPGDRALGGASSFHGTHVAGTIAAATNNGIGVAGIAWGSKVMPVRVLGLNGGTLYDVMQGVRFAAGLPNDSGTLPAHRADVINLSLAGGGFDAATNALFQQIHDAGVFVVAAAGNDASNEPTYPADYDGVISVAAVDLNRNPAPYSNFNADVDIAAPGGDTTVDRNADGWADGVLSTLADDSASPITFDYVFYQGTSMATPHVSGVLALMRSVSPALMPADVDTLLAQGKLTDDLGTPGWDAATGWGLIDARAAVVAAGAPDTSPVTSLSVSPSGLNFGLALDTLDLTVANASSDALSVSSVAVQNPAGAPWLAVSTVSVDGNGFGEYRAAVDRSSLGAGTYSATIDVVSTAGTVHVPVVMRVGGATASDAGFQYVLLVDANTLEVITEDALPATNGAYSYSFSNVPAGQYLVIAGSDMDNDMLVCDPGEACGAYPTIDLPTTIDLESDTAGANFDTSFRQSINTSASASSAGGAPAAAAKSFRRKR
ncbi:MAG TPA: S8 family serine peptidase [Myxococcota bacterium]|nr:S8 family serine peptidase [Myxococcota bacterium]